MSRHYVPDNRADVLQKVEVRVVGNTICNEWYASQGKSIHVASTQMCAGWEEGMRDSCWVSKKRPIADSSLDGHIHIFAFAHRCSLDGVCQSPDHEIYGSSSGHDANFNKYSRYRSNVHTMLFEHDSPNHAG